MTTARVALSSVLDTVAKTAGSVTAVLDATTKGIGMLDAFVTKAASEQQKRHVKSGLIFDESLRLEYATEVTTMKTTADEFCNKSPRHEELFNQAYAEIAQALSPKPSE